MQLLVESALLAAVGGALGIALSSLGLRGLTSLTPPDMARVSELRLDAQSVAVGMAMAFGSVTLFGVIPALRTLAAGERHRLMAGSVAGPTRRARHLRATLVGVEVALAVVLVTTTTLLARSFDGLRGIDTGMNTEGVWSFRVGLPAHLYPDAESRTEGAARLRTALANVPGVTGVGLSVGLPGWGWTSQRYQPPGATFEPERRPWVETRTADAGYWSVLGLTALRGRALGREDTPHSRPVAVVNASFARELWGDEDPVGRTLRVEDREVEIVGVAPDVREAGAKSPPRNTLYLPLSQWPRRGLSVVLRSASGEPPIDGVRTALAQIEGELALRHPMPLESVVLQSADEIRAMSRLVGTMAAAALFLAIIGVYAATNYSVTQRTPEIGVRMALGAPGRRVRQGVLGGALLVTAVGLSVGIPAAWGMAQVLSRFVIESAASSAAPYVAVAALLIAVTLIAAWIPARRASGIDPARALRAE